MHGVKEERQFQTIGVTEPRFSGGEPGYSTDVWIPYPMQNPSAFGNSGYGTLRVMGRPKDDVAVEQVHGVLQAAFADFRREDVANNFGANTPKDRVARFINTPLHVRSAATGPSPLRARFQRPLWVLSVIAADAADPLQSTSSTSSSSNIGIYGVMAFTVVQRTAEIGLRIALGAGHNQVR